MVVPGLTQEWMLENANTFVLATFEIQTWNNFRSDNMYRDVEIGVNSDRIRVIELTHKTADFFRNGVNGYHSTDML